MAELTTEKAVAELDVDDLCDDISISMAADDRQTRAEYRRGCEALSKLRAENARLSEEVARLKAERQWIPVGERMPGSCPEADCVLACDAAGIAYAAWNGREWFDYADENSEVLHGVTHWMPLPEPPK